MFTNNRLDKNGLGTPRKILFEVKVPTKDIKPLLRLLFPFFLIKKKSENLRMRI